MEKSSSISEWLKKAAKVVKNTVNKAAKYVAKVVVISVFTRTNPITAMNYINNAKVDRNKKTTTQNRLINDQNDTSGTGGNFRYGLYSASHNACETIAVHNAKVLKGIDSNLSATMLEFQMSNAMIGFGGLGSNPNYIGRVLSNSGIKYSRVGLDEMTQNGVYIMSYWTGTPYLSTIHTVAIKKDGGYFMYNVYGDGNSDDYWWNENLSGYEKGYICGYYIKG